MKNVHNISFCSVALSREKQKNTYTKTPVFWDEMDIETFHMQLKRNRNFLVKNLLRKNNHITYTLDEKVDHFLRKNWKKYSKKMCNKFQHFEYCLFKNDLKIFIGNVCKDLGSIWTFWSSFLWKIVLKSSGPTKIMREDIEHDF